MDSIEKNKIKGRQREAKYKIRFTNTAIDNFKVKDQLDKGNHSLTPVVVCKMNTREPLVIIGFNDLFELIKS